MTATITLGTKTISNLVKDIRDNVQPIQTSWNVFQAGEVHRKTKYYGTVRSWTLTVVEKVSVYGDSLYSYLLALAGTGDPITFSYSNSNYSVDTTVTVDRLDLGLNAESENPPHRFTVELKEYPG